MPLPLPDLDTRDWADLVQEGQALIPRYAPSWTDHNVHDPGITLIELFAWLVEQDIYRVNRIPDRHRLKFLTLIGFAPQGPRPARTMLAFAPPLGTENLMISAGFQFEGTDTDGHAAQFSTLRDLTVATAVLEAVQVSEHDSDGALITSDRTRQWRAAFPVRVLGSNPQPGAAFYLGFSDLPAGVPVTLAFRFDGHRHDEAERLRIIVEAEGQRRACRPVIPDIDCGTGTSDQEITAVPPHHSARIVWEASTGTGPGDWTALDAVAGLAPPGPGGVMDDTRSLTLDGIVEMNLPGSLVKTAVGSVVTDLFYVRARLVSGAYDALPVLAGVVLNAVVAEQAVPAWQTFVIAAGVVVGGNAPSFPSPAAQFAMIPTSPLAIEFDSAGLIQALTFGGGSPGQPAISVLDYDPPTSSNPGHLTVEMILAGFGTGRPHHRVVLPGAPLDIESLRLYSHDGVISWQEWLRVRDFDASARTDFHFVLDAVTGEVSFGDGERGRVAPADAAILATYRTTRGHAGSLDAGGISRHASTPHNDTLLGGWLPQAGGAGQLSTITSNVWNVRPGEDAEDLTHTAGRAVETLHAHERLVDLCAETACASLDQVAPGRVRALAAPSRAVNLLDLERLAIDVPGTHVARSRAWASAHPAYPCLDAVGVVTVVVLPDMPIPRPEPSKELLRAITRFLDRRRTVGTRIEVVGPHYVEVSVDARIRALPYASPDEVKGRIHDALNAFFDPRRGGPSGLGWPFGRDVYRSEVMQVLDGVAGVDHVIELSLSADGGEPQCGNLTLCPTWLVTPLVYRIEVSLTPASGEWAAASAPALPVCPPEPPA